MTTPSMQPQPSPAGYNRPYASQPGKLIPRIGDYGPAAQAGQQMRFSERGPGLRQALNDPRVQAYMQYKTAHKEAIRPPQYQRALTEGGTLPSALQVSPDQRGFQAMRQLATNYGEGPLSKALDRQSALQAGMRRDQATRPTAMTLSQALRGGVGSPQSAMKGIEQGLATRRAREGGLAQALQGYGRAGQQLLDPQQRNVQRLAALRDLEQKRDVQAFSDWQKFRAGEELAAAAKGEDKKWYEFWK